MISILTAAQNLHLHLHLSPHPHPYLHPHPHPLAIRKTAAVQWVANPVFDRHDAGLARCRSSEHARGDALTSVGAPPRAIED